jgi:hypothetical protein
MPGDSGGRDFAAKETALYKLKASSTPMSPSEYPRGQPASGKISVY